MKRGKALAKGTKPLSVKCVCGCAKWDHAETGDGKVVGCYKAGCDCNHYRPKRSLKQGATIKARGKRRFPKGEDREYQAWIRTHVCTVAAQCSGFGNTITGSRSEAAHVRSKGAGGSDQGNLVPLCRQHHREQHDIGIRSFQRKYDINLREVAGALWLEFEQSKGVTL